MGVQTVLAATSPLGVMLAVVGLLLLIWTTVDLWRNDTYTTSNKIGWQLVIGGLVVGPLVSFGDGWFIGFPLGVLAYVLLAKHGPVRRRRARHRAADVDRPAVTDGEAR